MASPFEVLGVDADADEAEIERAYRERVKEAHPDHGGSIEEFRTVRTAYETLTGDDPARRHTTSSDRGTERRTQPEHSESEVTYLNYDVLADFGWDIDDGELFWKAAAADLEEPDYGEFRAQPGQSLLEAAEDHGFEWPFACRGGACANCAIFLRKGELSMPVSHVLPAEMMERGIRLSCNGIPLTDELEVVYNVKHMPELDELLLPPRPFEQAYSD
ncbi:ferredoxin [Halobacteriales archaeon QS_1_67_19]|nr:MAG: ferredoxin [Halobacteriales archaeon QS_1_67_19]